MSRKTPKESRVHEDQCVETSEQSPGSLTSREEQLSEIERVLAQAQRGDTSVLPTLRRLLQTNPLLWRVHGDFATIALQTWIKTVCGRNLLAVESMNLRCFAEIDELIGEDTTPMKRILVERVVSCRLQTLHAETTLAMTDSTSVQLIAALDKRVTGCQKRLSAALKDLAIYEKELGKSTSRPAGVTSSPRPVAKAAAPNNGSAVAATPGAEPVDPIRRALGMVPEPDAVAPNNGDSAPRNGYENRIKRHFAPVEA